MSGLDITMRGHSSRFHTHCAWKITSASRAVCAIGMAMRPKITYSFAPSMRALSM